MQEFFDYLGGALQTGRGTVKAGILRNMSAILNWGENCGNSKAKGFAQASGLYCR